MNTFFFGEYPYHLYNLSNWESKENVFNDVILQKSYYEHFMSHETRHQFSTEENHETNECLSAEKPDKPSPKFVSSFSIDNILSETKSSQQKPMQEKSNKPNRNFTSTEAYYYYHPQILEERASKVDPNVEGKYVCFMCNKGYSRRHQLKIHFRSHTGYKPLHCIFCGKTFGDQSNLNKHKKTHMKISLSFSDRI